MFRWRNRLIKAFSILLVAGLNACAGPAESGTPDDHSRKSSQVWQTPPSVAFVGARGFGSGSKGGRGGRIFQVRTLADSGPGSLRECIEAMGPRVCIFRVAGIIRFTGAPPRIRHPYITIAGQTAPGGGITLAHSGGEFGLTPLVIKDTHDVVVRHIRVRNDRIGNQRGSEDSLTIENSSHVIVDHVSASWARDELINGHGENNFITISNSIFSWGIPPHDKCALLASDPQAPQNFSFIGNLCAHSGDRNPDINFPPGSCVEVLGNVFYNAESEFAEIWESYGGTPGSIMGNSFVAGPNTRRNAIGISRKRTGSNGTARIFLSDNLFLGDFPHHGASIGEIELSEPECDLTSSPASSQDAYQSVLARAGAFPRDALDRQVVSDVQERRGGIMRAPGIIPPILRAYAGIDTDDDGMPDDWEEVHGSNPGIPDPWEDSDADGLANFEAYLEFRHHSLIGNARSSGPS